MNEYLSIYLNTFACELRFSCRYRNLLKVSIWLQTWLFAASIPCFAQNLASTPNLQNYSKVSQGLVKELESGLSRIQKNCGEVKTPALKDGYPTDEVMSKIKASHAISESEMKKVSNKVSTSSQGLLSHAPSKCQLPGFSLIDSNCKALDLQISKLKTIEAEAQALYKETVDRYKFYIVSVQLENSNCARAGFSAKLWQTEEQFVQPNFLRFSGFFIQQVDDLLSKP